MGPANRLVESKDVALKNTDYTNFKMVFEQWIACGPTDDVDEQKASITSHAERFCRQ
jgi:hypothetical protein